MIDPAGGGASPVDLEALEKLLERTTPGDWVWNPTVRSLAIWQGRYARPIYEDHKEHNWSVSDGDAEFIAQAPELLRQCLSELRAWRSQQVMIAGLVNGYYNGSEPDAIGAFRALRAIADVLGKPMEASPLPQEATPEDDRTKIKS